jgi:hypothetical protein
MLKIWNQTEVNSMYLLLFVFQATYHSTRVDRNHNQRLFKEFKSFSQIIVLSQLVVSNFLQNPETLFPVFRNHFIETPKQFITLMWSKSIQSHTKALFNSLEIIEAFMMRWTNYSQVNWVMQTLMLQNTADSIIELVITICECS